MHIRPATIDDLEAISRLITSEEELFLVYPKGQFPLTVKQVKILFDERFEFTVFCVNEDSNNIDGIAKEEKIVGFANLYGKVEFQYAYIGNIFLTQDYRGKGYPL